jgi:hypothetical protein
VTATAIAKRAPGRPKTDPETADREALLRVANLAFSILTCLCFQDRSRYSSENQLLEFLRSDGVSFATKDVNPALTLLESMDMLVRPPVPPNIARPGWLPTSADAPVPVPVLIDAIIRVLGAGLCGSEEDLQARLNAAGVAFDSHDLNISRLHAVAAVDPGRSCNITERLPCRPAQTVSRKRQTEACPRKTRPCPLSFTVSRCSWQSGPSCNC